MATSFDHFLESTRTIADLDAANAVLSWDQETNMPPAASEGRAEQLATLSGVAHRMRTAPDYTGLLDELRRDGAGLEDWQQAAVRETARDIDRAAKLPEKHVSTLARESALAHDAWKKARAASDFSLFRNNLRALVELKRREAELVGYGAHPYDALLDIFEPGMTVATLRPIFSRLLDGTRELLAKVKESGTTVDSSMLHRSFDAEKQMRFSHDTVAALGFDFSAGRVDLAAHPFCTSFGIRDVRLTTRIYPDDLRSCLFGLIHEAGHGMYEQGFDPMLARTPLASGISMGIHESQSLFWENMIGRSHEFWTWAYPRLQATFPDQLSDVDLESFYRAVNVVEPSHIRVEADELTYNLHIMLRFEIETGLIDGSIEVDDVPAIWNKRTEEYLGITPENDAIGCLQDIHWSFAGFGYFPSYTLGKLYAAMLREAIVKDLPNVTTQIESGDFSAILEWLREKLHRWGKRKTASEVISDICGATLSERPFLEYNARKVARVYQTSV